MAREKSAVPGLRFVTTEQLVAEIRRRSLGCLIAVVRAEEHGDAWRCAVKGSPILLGALSAALTLEIDKSLKQPASSPHFFGGQDERRNCLRHPGAA